MLDFARARRSTRAPIGPLACSSPRGTSARTFTEGSGPFTLHGLLPPITMSAQSLRHESALEPTPNADQVIEMTPRDEKVSLILSLWSVGPWLTHQVAEATPAADLTLATSPRHSSACWLGSFPRPPPHAQLGSLGPVQPGPKQAQLDQHSCTRRGWCAHLERPPESVG